jgi:hypothetical protein
VVDRRLSAVQWANMSDVPIPHGTKRVALAIFAIQIKGCPARQTPTSASVPALRPPIGSNAPALPSQLFESANLIRSLHRCNLIATLRAILLTVRTPTAAAVALLAVVAMLLLAAAPLSARPLGARTAIDATARTISGSSAFSLPSSTSCVSGHTLTVRLRKVPHIVWTAERIKVDGKLVRVVTRAHIGRAVTLAGLPSGKFVVAILATTSRRRTAALSRIYHTCSAGAPRGPYPGPPALPAEPLDVPTGLGLTALTSGTPVEGAVTGPASVDYTFTAVAGQHVTIAITNPHVAPAESKLQMKVLDSSGAEDKGGVVFNTTPTEIDFTPTSAEAGPTTVVIGPYDTGTTGTFTLTYAADVTGELTSGVATSGAIAVAGQHGAYTFPAVAGEHVTVMLSSPLVEPSGNRLQMQVLDSSGAEDEGGVVFNTTPTEIDFTPTSTTAGTTTVLISAYDFETLGRFTLTYAKDVRGTLTSGVPTEGAIAVAGQHADYTFNAIAGRHVTLAVTKPDVSPMGQRLEMQVLDSSGAEDAGGAVFSTSPTDIEFTPSSLQEGPTTVVISPYDFETIGSFVLTLTEGP